jgi:hypothetical protein
MMFLATYWSFNKAKYWLSWLFFCVSALFTFAILWLVPVVIYEAWRKNNQLAQTLLVFTGVGIVYLGLNYIGGYNYLQSLQIAQSIESPGDWLAKTTSWPYYTSRLENVLEIGIFLGICLIPFLYHGGWALIKARQVRSLGMVGLVAGTTLLGVFATGSYHTGETARAAMYIYPFVLFSVIYYLSLKRVTDHQITVIMHLVFGQTVLMQMFGWYYW